MADNRKSAGWTKPVDTTVEPLRPGGLPPSWERKHKGLDAEVERLRKVEAAALEVVQSSAGNTVNASDPEGDFWDRIHALRAALGER